MKQTVTLIFTFLLLGGVTAQVNRDAFNKQRQQMQEQYAREREGARQQYAEARKKAEAEYAAFRKKANEEYAEAVRKACQPVSVAVAELSRCGISVMAKAPATKEDVFFSAVRRQFLQRVVGELQLSVNRFSEKLYQLGGELSKCSACQTMTEKCWTGKYIEKYIETKGGQKW